MKLKVVVFKNPIDYQDTIKKMDALRDAIHLGLSDPQLWLLEHNKIYTYGKNTPSTDIIDQEIQLIKSNRGGKCTHHCPGQRVGYLIMDIKKWNNGSLDIKLFVENIQKAIIQTLEEFGIKSYCDPENIGVWVKNNNNKQKIAAIGVNISKFISTHGFSLNINNDLSGFDKIKPCGIEDKGVCSIKSLGIDLGYKDLDPVLIAKICNIFSLELSEVVYE